MNKKLFCSFVLILFLHQFAIGQTKLGNNVSTLDPNALLEMESNTKGLLLPRLNLVATNSFAPMTAFVPGMIVYNTASSGIGTTAVTPGVYYCDGTKWIRGTNGGGSGWSLAGNTGTNAANDFLGTTDNAALVFKTNNSEAARIDASGRLSLANVPAGNAATDSILVQSAVGNIIKKVPAGSYFSAAQQSLNVVALSGQTVFTTPFIITDPNKILLYRNGVQIGFTIATNNTIISEIATVQGDEMKIVQLQ